MMNRNLLVLVLSCLSAMSGFAQLAPNAYWNCNSRKNNKLICLVPVSTGSIGAHDSPAPAFNSAFATQLSQLPLLSSGPGIAVTYDPQTGVPTISDSLGPILTDRAQTIGKHKLLVAFAYQRFRFNSIDGTSLNDVPLVFATSSGSGGTTYNVQQQDISFKLDQYVGVATYGLTDKIDISVVVPFERVSIGSTSFSRSYAVAPDNTIQSIYPPLSQAPQTQYVPGTATGFGDVLVTVKGLVLNGEQNKIAVGMLFRFPTGDALNYLGSGAYGFNPYAVWSFQAGRFSPHGRIGFLANTSTTLIPNPVTGLGSSTLPNSAQYNIGADYVLFRKIPTTVAADLLGNYVINSPLLLPGLAPSSPPSAQTLIPTTGTYNSDQIAIGAKVKPWKDLILYGNVTFQVNNVGLKSAPVPLVGLSYTFNIK